MAKARVRTTNTDAFVPSTKPPKAPTTKLKTAGRLMHPLMKVGGRPVSAPPATEPRRHVLTCPADRTQVYGKGKTAKSVTEPCRKMMSVYVDPAAPQPVVRCCFCYAEHPTADLLKAGHLVQEDL